MRNWLTASRILSAVLLALFAGTSLLITFGKKEKVLPVIARIFGEKERYDEAKIARVLQVVFAIFAVLELLNLVFAKTAAVPAICIPVALIICYLSLLYIERRCKKRRTGGETAQISESYGKDTEEVPISESYGKNAEEASSSESHGEDAGDGGNENE